MTTVYIVTSGEYSDYRINRVYLDRGEAEAHVKFFNSVTRSEPRRVEEWSVGEPAGKVEGPGWTKYMSSPTERDWVSADAAYDAYVPNRRFPVVHGFNKAAVEAMANKMTEDQEKARNAGTA